MTPQVMRAIAIALVLISLTFSILRRTEVIAWDLGVARWPILIVAVILLLYARSKEKR